MSTTTPQNIRNAVAIMRGGMFGRPVNDPWDMAGDAHKGTRVAVASFLLGRKAKVAEAGVTNLVQLFGEAFGIPPSERHPWKIAEHMKAVREEMSASTPAP